MPRWGNLDGDVLDDDAAQSEYDRVRKVIMGMTHDEK